MAHLQGYRRGDRQQYLESIRDRLSLRGTLPDKNGCDWRQRRVSLGLAATVESISEAFDEAIALAKQYPIRGGDVSANVIDLETYRVAFERLAQSRDPFPVSLDDAWRWIGYSRKSDAKAALTNNFIEGVDYVAAEDPAAGKPHNYELIKLTSDCFESFCLMAGTERGKQLRGLYIEIRKRYFSLKHNDVGFSPSFEGHLIRLLDQLTVGTTQTQSAIAVHDKRLDAVEHDIAHIK